MCQEVRTDVLSAETEDRQGERQREEAQVFLGLMMHERTNTFPPDQAISGSHQHEGNECKGSYYVLVLVKLFFQQPHHT